MVTKRPPERIYLRRPFFPLSRCGIVAWYSSRIEGSGRRGERNQIRSDIVFSGFSSNVPTSRHSTPTVPIFIRKWERCPASPRPPCRFVSVVPLPVPVFVPCNLFSFAVPLVPSRAVFSRLVSRPVVRAVWAGRPFLGVSGGEWSGESAIFGSSLGLLAFIFSDLPLPIL